MNPFLLFLAVSDLFSAFFLISGITHPLVITFLWIHSVKGFTSLLGSMASGYYFDWMGVTDILAAVLIVLISVPLLSGIFRGIAFFVGILMGIKGLYSLMFGIGG